MTAGEFVYLIRADKSQLNKTLDESEKETKQWGNKLSAWTVAKGQMIGQFATKLITKVNDVTTAVMKNTLKAYGTFEQLSGGAELLFGSAYDKIMDKAENAFQTVQMSANEYLEAVNGYAVGLRESLGGDEQAAADLADRIITAQADIVAATGRSREAVQNAFAGVMRGNFMMLDNLGLGIKGSKEGMEDVIKTVNEWNKAQGKATKYQIGNLADMENALVDYVEKVGMAGYAGKEAASTLEGTIASTKAAWENLLVAFGSGKDVKKATQNLADSAKKMLKNMLPVAKNTIQSIGDFVAEIIPEIGKWMSNLSSELKKSDNPIVAFIGEGIEKVQTALQGASNLVNNFEETVNALQNSDDPIGKFVGDSLATVRDLIKLVISLINDFDKTTEELKNSEDPFKQLLGGALQTGKKALEWITTHKQQVVDALKVMAGGFLAFKTAKGVSEVTNLIRSLRGINATSGASAGSSWGSAFAAAVLKAAPWLVGLYTLLKPAETASDDLDSMVDEATGELTTAGKAVEEQVKEAERINAEIQKETNQKLYSSQDNLAHVWENQLSTVGSKNPTAWVKLNKERMEAVQGLWKSQVLGGGFFSDEAYDKFEKAFAGQEDLADRVTELMDAYMNTFSEGLPWDEYPLNLPADLFKPEEPVDFDAEPKVDLDALQNQLDMRTFRATITPNLSYNGFKPHAKGLWSVPYDNYPALLHRDEQVLTKSQARQGTRDVDYEYIGGMIGTSVERAMSRIFVALDGNKVGDFTTRRTNKNIRRQEVAVLRGMGG